MKLLAFVDLHGDASLLRQLVKRAKEKDIDLVVAAGDLTWFGDHLEYVVKKLNTIGKKVLIIHGNHEDNEHLKEVIEKYSNCIAFHGKAIKIEDFIFLGYGEGGFALNDPEFRKLAREWYGEYKNEKIILVTHAPPFGTELDKVNGKHTGNKDMAKFIERIKPKLVVCGHIHETAGKTDKIGETSVINPGWDGMVVELS